MTFLDFALQKINHCSNPLPWKSSAAVKQQITGFFISEYEPLAFLYEELKVLPEPLNLQISEVQHNRYHKIYTMQREEEKAAMQFYYNGLNQFTSGQNIPVKCNCDKLLKDLESSINELKKM